MKEVRQEICCLCNNIKNYDSNFHILFVIINFSNYTINNIENILNYSFVLDGLCVCEKCNYGPNLPTCRINYKIIQYPQFLLVLFDFRSYNELKENLDNIKRFFVDTLVFSENDKYNFIGCITSPCYNHFTFYLNKINLILYLKI